MGGYLFLLVLRPDPLFCWLQHPKLFVNMGMALLGFHFNLGEYTIYAQQKFNIATENCPVIVVLPIITYQIVLLSMDLFIYHRVRYVYIYTYIVLYIYTLYIYIHYIYICVCMSIHTYIYIYIIYIYVCVCMSIHTYIYMSIHIYIYV